MWSKSIKDFDPYAALEQESLLFQPPAANTQLIFGTDFYNNFSVVFYRNKPLSKFQILMYKIFFGVTAINLESK